MRAKKVIIVGTGYWSNKMHLPALLPLVQQKKIEVVGVCDLNIGDAKIFAEKVACKQISNSFEDLISSARPDGAILLVPPTVMPSLIIKCLQFKLPFLCEKPPATDLNTHQQLIEMSSDLPHIVGYNRRFSPFINQAAEWSSNQTIDSINCDFTRVNRIDEDFSTTYIHGVDAVIFLSKSTPIHIIAEVQYKEKHENIFLSGKMKNGMIFYIRIMPSVESSQERYFIRGTNTSIDVSFSQGISIDSPGYAELHQNDKIVEHKSPIDFNIPFDDFVGLGGFTFEHNAFYDLLNQKKCTVSTLQNTLASQIIRDHLCDGIGKKRTTFEINI